MAYLQGNRVRLAPFYQPNGESLNGKAPMLRIALLALIAAGLAMCLLLTLRRALRGLETARDRLRRDGARSRATRRCARCGTFVPRQTEDARTDGEDFRCNRCRG